MSTETIINQDGYLDINEGFGGYWEDKRPSI